MCGSWTQCEAAELSVWELDTVLGDVLSVREQGSVWTQCEGAGLRVRELGSV